MKRLFHPFLFALLVIAIAGVWYSFGVINALADTPPSTSMPVIDAGVGSAAAAPIVDATQLANPATNPLVAVDQLEQLEAVGWPLAVLAGLIMLLDIVSLCAPRWPRLAAWLGQGRRPMLVAGAGAVAAAAFHSIALGGNWYAMIVAVMGTLLALRSPAPHPSLVMAAKKAAVTAVLLVCLVGLGACAASSRTTALQGSLTTANAARAAFVAFDAHHQQDLVAQAKDKPSLDTAVATWRTQREPVEKDLTAAYQAIAAAAISDTDPSLAAAVAALVELQQALKTIGVTVP
ncbi:MAG TPA: hypothetical protein VGF94_08095 [Kofleriaceae bacterium]